MSENKVHISEKKIRNLKPMVETKNKVGTTVLDSSLLLIWKHN